MAVAVLLFGLIVGVMQISGPSEVEPGDTVAKSSVMEEARAAAAEPVVPAKSPSKNSYTETVLAEAKTLPASSRSIDLSGRAVSVNDVLASARSKAELNQMVADLVAHQPSRAGSIVTIALAQRYQKNTIGDVALITSSAVKAAPDQAVSIAAAVARSMRNSAPALAAVTASIIVLVPEHAQQVATVVGAVVGDEPKTLGMVAQTVAISSGEEIFTSLSNSSGVAASAVMRESFRLGIAVPFEVPDYAAQTAPQSSMVAYRAARRLQAERTN